MMATYFIESEFVGGLVRSHNERLYVPHVDISAGDGNG